MAIYKTPISEMNYFVEGMNEFKGATGFSAYFETATP